MRLNRLASLVLLATLAAPAAGASVPGTDDVPALAASVRDHETKTTKRLLADQAAVDEADAHGWTALMFAAARGDANAIRDLIKAGAAVDRGDRKGATALMQAANFGRRDAVKALLEAGAKPDARNDDGEAAIDFAIRGGDKNVIAQLSKDGFPAAKPPENASGPKSVFVRPEGRNIPMPRYTNEARRRGISGETVVYVLVGADGVAKESRVIVGLPAGLSSQAAKAAAEVRWTPATRDGVPVETWVVVHVSFDQRS